MERVDKDKIASIKRMLVDKLMHEKAFWSYAPSSVSSATIDDDMLIAQTMRHLDLDEIKLLFKLFPYEKVKSAWKRLLVPEGDYLYTLNRFFAWYFFKAKRPDAYLKTIQTRHMNLLLASL